MPIDRFVQSTAGLRDLGGQRVWSLMISLFGDLAQGPEDQIDGPVLSAIMGLLQIRPEAARVALHRLRNDGWIRSEKSGRISLHSLSAKGRAESASASPRIYAPDDDADQDWQVVLLEASSAEAPVDMTARGFVSLTTRTYVGPATASPPEGALSLTGGTIPNWLRRELAPEDLRAEYVQLAETLTTLSARLDDLEPLSPIQIAVLRCLIVHNWRRLVLRHPALPPALLPQDWPGLDCHRQVNALLARFERPKLTEIERQLAAA